MSFWRQMDALARAYVAERLAETSWKFDASSGSFRWAATHWRLGHVATIHPETLLRRIEGLEQKEAEGGEWA